MKWPLTLAPVGGGDRAKDAYICKLTCGGFPASFSVDLLKQVRFIFRKNLKPPKFTFPFLTAPPLFRLHRHQVTSARGHRTQDRASSRRWPSTGSRACSGVNSSPLTVAAQTTTTSSTRKPAFSSAAAPLARVVVAATAMTRPPTPFFCMCWRRLWRHCWRRRPARGSVWFAGFIFEVCSARARVSRRNKHFKK